MKDETLTYNFIECNGADHVTTEQLARLHKNSCIVIV